MAKYIIQVPGFKSIFGFIKGVYEVEGPDSSPHEFYLDSGSYTIEIPASEISRYYEEGTDIAEVLRDELRSGSVEKLVDAGKELADLKEENQRLTNANIQADKSLREANETLQQITEQLEALDKEHEDFFINPHFPVSSLEIVRDKLIRLKMVVSKLETEIGNTGPVKVPAEVAKSLDVLYAENGGNGDWAHSAVMFYSYTPPETESPLFNPLYIPHLSKVSLWRLGNMDLFPDLMKYGYEAEKTEREMKLDRIKEIFVDEKLSTNSAAELIYELFKGEQA